MSRDGWRNIASLIMSARVKHFSSTLLHALEGERHFAFIEGVAFALPTVRLAGNRFPGQDSVRVRPMHLFGRNRDHDYYFELPHKKGSGIPNQFLGVLLHTMAMYGWLAHLYVLCKGGDCEVSDDSILSKEDAVQIK